VGVHPCELKGKDPSVAELLALAEDDNIIAIGEMLPPKADKSTLSK
jgi:TatD DNase family protein